MQSFGRVVRVPPRFASSSDSEDANHGGTRTTLPKDCTSHSLRSKLKTLKSQSGDKKIPNRFALLEECYKNALNHEKISIEGKQVLKKILKSVDTFAVRVAAVEAAIEVGTDDSAAARRRNNRRKRGAP